MMKTPWALIVAASVTLATYAQAALPIAGGWFNLFDDTSAPHHGPIQVAGFSCGRMSNSPDDVGCAVYVGLSDIEKYDRKTIVDLADQVFDEMVGFDCAVRAMRSDVDAKWRPVPRCTIYIGDIIVTVLDQGKFRQSLLQGAFTGATRVEYAIKQMPPGAPEGKGFYATEYVRTSQPDIAVGPSHREPNRNAVPREIEPGISIRLENEFDITYFEEERPTHIVHFQTTTSITDKPAIAALCEKVVKALTGERLARHELNAVRLAAFNEPKLSRFHFRPTFTYNADGDGKNH